MSKQLYSLLLSLALTTMALTPSIAQGAESRLLSFDRSVAPLLSEYCFDCHRGPEPKGELDLSRRDTAFRGGESGPAIVAGDLDDSLVWQMIETDDMPPEHPLPDAEKKIIRDWIAGGAKWGSDPIDLFRYSSDRRAGYDWWSLQPLTKPPVPTIGDDQWSQNAIDRFVLARLQTKGLEPSLSDDPRTLVRRLYVDLIGLPPPAETIDKFQQDPSPAAWERLVDNLLASPHYGERWARHWLDVVRFGESDGYEYNSPRNSAWHYRDWVIQALNSDLPYDEFTRMQLAGDLLKPDTLEGAAAVAFLVAGTHNPVLGTSPAMKAAARHDELEEIAGTVGQTFLGLTVNCARCHDHKFDPISTREYYSFIASLDGVNHGERSIRIQTDEDARREELTRRRDALEYRLTDSVLGRGGLISESANQVWTKDSIKANKNGETYRLSFKIAPSSWASPVTSTNERDGVIVSILNKDGFVIASHLSKPGLWKDGRKANQYQWQSFEYTGDGTGQIHVHLRPFPLHTNRFAGAVDDVKIMEVGSNKRIFEESFENLQQRFGPRSQAKTRRPVYFLGTSKHWKHSGFNSIHAVEHADGNFALQLYSGTTGEFEITADGSMEQELQREINLLDTQLGNLPPDTLQVYSVVSDSPEIMRVLLRGDVTRLGDEVVPSGINAIKNVPASFDLDKAASDRERRLALANWISCHDNGPFHRVVVNRVWHYHFGQGIVTSPNDFGFSGGQPSHPELLDWLSVWFRENGYSLKKLHKLVVTSATYQQSSQSNPRAAQVDASNRLLWRQNPRRVEGEVLRDSMLDVAGLLNRKPFGPGYQDIKIVRVPPAFYYLPVDPVGHEFNRRTVYRWSVRGQRSSLLDTFDCPDPSTKTPSRMVTTTPSQALSQWNHPFVLRMSEELAQRITSEFNEGGNEDTAEKYVNRAWRLILGRLPAAKERAGSVRLTREHGLPLLCRVLFNSNEFVMID